MEIIDRSEDDGDVMEKNQVATDTEPGTLVKLEGCVLSQVTELESDKEGREGSLVSGHIVLGPVDGQEKVETRGGHDGGMERRHDLVAKVVVLLGIGFWWQNGSDGRQLSEGAKEQWIEGEGTDQ